MRRINLLDGALVVFVCISSFVLMNALVDALAH
jgi:hypothetical protein